MRRVFFIMTILIALLGISDVAFAKRHSHPYKAEDNKEDNGRKVRCLVKGVQQMVRTESVCKDFDGTVVTEITPQKATAVSKEKTTAQKTQSK